MVSNRSSGSLTEISNVRTVLVKAHHVRSVQRFTHAVEVLGAGARKNEVLCEEASSEQVHRADVRLIVAVETGNDRLGEIGSESDVVVSQSYRRMHSELATHLRS